MTIIKTYDYETEINSIVAIAKELRFFEAAKLLEEIINNGKIFETEPYFNETLEPLKICNNRYVDVVDLLYFLDGNLASIREDLKL